MINKKIIFFLVTSFLGFSLTSFAQTVNFKQGGVVATVNIYNATITKQNENNFDISFDISNREGIQFGVKYGILLEQENSSSTIIADNYLYDETLTLDQNIIHKDIKYTAPNNLDGNYNISLISKNDGGLPYSNILLGKIKLNKTSNNADVRNNLNLNNKSYSIQGVNVDKKIYNKGDDFNTFIVYDSKYYDEESHYILISLKNEKNNDCINTINIPIKSMSMGVVKISDKIINNCANLNIEVKILDKNKEILDSKNYKIDNGLSSSKDLIDKKILIVIFSLIIILAIYFAIKNKKASVVTIFAISFIFNLGQAKADTYIAPSGVSNLPATASQSWSSSDPSKTKVSSTWIIPDNVTSLVVNMWGAGGGGGGADGYGDTHTGGGGGSGGLIKRILAVTSGKTVSMTTGLGGAPGWYWFNDQYHMICSASMDYSKESSFTMTKQFCDYMNTNGFHCDYNTVGRSYYFYSTNNSSYGVNGQNSQIKVGDWPTLTAGGGGGGSGAWSDNCAPYSGAGGTGDTNGNNGGTINCNRNHFDPTRGGYPIYSDGYVFADGGNSNSDPEHRPVACPTRGRDGAIVITYTVLPATSIDLHFQQ